MCSLFCLFGSTQISGRVYASRFLCFALSIFLTRRVVAIDPPGLRGGGQMLTTQKNINCVPSPGLSNALDFMSIS